MKQKLNLNENENENEMQDEKPAVDDMLIGRIYKKQLAQTKDDIEKIIASKIQDRIESKKAEFFSRMQGQ